MRALHAVEISGREAACSSGEESAAALTVEANSTKEMIAISGAMVDGKMEISRPTSAADDREHEGSCDVFLFAATVSLRMT